jgi:hypothetical protein
LGSEERCKVPQGFPQLNRQHVASTFDRVHTPKMVRPVGALGASLAKAGSNLNRIECFAIRPRSI